MINEHEILIYNFLNFLKQSSRCIDKQVACVITCRGEIVSHGVNRVIRCDKNCDDKKNRTCEVEHAEIVAVENLAYRPGTTKQDFIAYINLFPCIPCQDVLRDFVSKIVVFGPKHKGQIFTEIELKNNFAEELLDYNGKTQPSILQGELAELISSVGDYFYRNDKGDIVEPVLDEIVDVENQLTLLKQILWRDDKETYNKLREIRKEKTYDLFGRLIAKLL